MSSKDNKKIKISSNYGAESGGISTATYQQVNKIYDESRFTTPQGHGFAAERELII